MITRTIPLLGPILVLAITPSLVAQDFGIPWYTIDGGGEMFSSGGSFEMSGTIGQPDAGGMSGGNFELAGGFWSGVEDAFCFGDLDGSGGVGLGDLAQLLANYPTASGATYEDGDLDGDGDVDLSDLAALLAIYDTPC